MVATGPGGLYVVCWSSVIGSNHVRMNIPSSDTLSFSDEGRGGRWEYSYQRLALAHCMVASVGVAVAYARRCVGCDMCPRTCAVYFSTLRTSIYERYSLYTRTHMFG